MQLLNFVFILIFASSPLQRVEDLLDTGYQKYLDENYVSAIEDFSKAIALDEDNAEAYYLRGVCHLGQEKKKLAIRDLDKATELKPDYAEAYYEKGFIYLIDQNAKLAIEEFNRVIAIKPDMAEAYVSRGTAKCMLDDSEGAAADWATAKELGVPYSEYMVCE